MPLYGRIVVIKRDGTDGAQFHLTSPVCTFGRDSTCDIRVQLPSVAKEHCRIEVDNSSGQIFLVNLCEIWPTQLNKAPVENRVEVKHKDVFTVTERSFRLEFPSGSPFRDDSLEDASPVNDEKPAIRMTPSLTASNKRKILSPIAARHSSTKTPVVTPGRAVKSTVTTPATAAKYSSGRTSGAGVATSAAKAKVTGASSSRKSDILSAEIAELKSALLKAREKTPTAKPTAIVKPTTTPSTKANSFLVASAKIISSTPMLKTPDTLSKLSSSRNLTTPGTKLLAGNVSLIKTPRTNSKVSVQPLSSKIHQVRKTISPKMLGKAGRRSSGITPATNKGRKSTDTKQITEDKLADSECKNLDFALEGSFIKDTTGDQNLKGLEMSGVKNAEKSSSCPENAPGNKLKALFDDSYGSSAKRYSSALPAKRSSSLTTPSKARTSEPSSTRRPRSSTSAASPASTARKSKSLSKSPASNAASKRSPSPKVLNSLPGSAVKSPRLSSGRKSRSPTKTPTVNSGRRSSSGAKVLDRHSNSPIVSPLADRDEPSFGSDGTGEGRKSVKKKSDRINSSMPKDSDPGSLRTKVNHLRRKSMPLVEESELPPVRAGVSEAEMDFAFTNESRIQNTNSSEKKSHKSRKSTSPVSRGVKRSGSPLKGRPSKRCVSFGPEISPELFDQNLPTKTPLKRGATPRRVSIAVDRVEQHHKPLLKKRFSSILAIEESRSSKNKSPNREPKLTKAKGEASPISAGVSNSPTKTAAKTPAESVLAPSSTVASTSGSQQKRIFTSGTKTTRTAAGKSPKLSPTSDDTSTPKSTSNKSPSSVRNLKEVQNVDPFVYESSPDSSPSRSSRKTPLSVSATFRASLGEHEPTRRGSLEPESSSLIKSKRKSTAKSEENISSPLFNDDVKSPVHKRSPAQATPKGSRSRSLSSAGRISSETGSARRRAVSSERKSVRMSAEPGPEFSGLGQIQIQLFDNEELSKGTPSRVESAGRRRSKSLLRRSFANSFDDSSQSEEDQVKSAKSNRKSSLLAESLNSSKMSAADEGVHGRMSLDQFNREIEDLFAAVKIKPSRAVTPKAASSKSSPKSPKGRRSLRQSSLQKISYESPENKKEIKSLGTENSETLTSEAAEPSVLKPTSGRKSYPANKSSAKKTTVGATKVSASPTKVTFRRSFVSEPRKLRASKTGRLSQPSLEVAKTATRTRKPTKMVSERNIDLANISPLKFYKSPANEIVKQRRSKVTPGRAVALRAVFGKAALPSLSQLQKSKASPSSGTTVTELKAPVEKLNLGEADAVRKHTVNRKSKVPRPVKPVNKKTGFAVKEKQTKLVLKPKPGEKSFGKIAGKILAVRKVKQRQLIRKPDAVQKTVVTAETELIEVLYNKEDSESSVSHLTVETPPGPGEMFVSPWSTPTPDKNSGNKRSSRKHPGSNNTSGSKRRNTSKADARGSPLLSGLKTLVKTPKVQASPRLSGVRAMMKTPAVQESPELGGLRDLMKTMTIPDSPRFGGLREMMKTPKVQNSPQMIGLKTLVKTPKVQQSPELGGLKRLMKTPKAEASPKLGGLRKMLKTPKLQKSPRLAGIKEMMKSPKTQKSPQLSGVRKLVKTPKVQQSPRLSGVRQLVKSPKQQKSPKLSGLKALTKTPKVQNSPDLRNLKSLFNAEKETKTPRLDGLKPLLTVPKSQASPDYTGLMELVASPPSLVGDTPKTSKGRRNTSDGGAKMSAKMSATKPSPRLSGSRKLPKTPKAVASPDSYGIQQLLQTPDVEQSTAKKARGKAASTRKTPLTKEKLHQSLLKTGSTKGKRRTGSAKVSRELISTAASELSPVSPQVVKKTKRVSNTARGSTPAHKEDLELSLNTQGGDVGKDSKVVRNKRKRSDYSEAAATSKKRRLNESGISETETGIVTEIAKDFEPVIRKTRRNQKLDALPNTATQNVEVGIPSAKTPSKGRGRNKPVAVPEGSRASSKVIPASDVGPAVILSPRNRRGKKQPVEEEELVIVPQGQVKNSRTKRGSKKSSEDEIPSVMPAAELPKRRQGKQIPNGNDAVGSNLVTGKGNKKTSLKVSTSVEVLVVEAVKSNRRGRQGKSVSAEALLQSGNDGENEVKPRSKTVEKGKGRSRRELAVEDVTLQNQTSGRRGTRAKNPVADSLSKQVADKGTVDPTANRKGTGRKKVVEVKEPEVVFQVSDKVGRRQPAARGRRVILNDGAYLADILVDAAEHDDRSRSQKKSRPNKNEESKNTKGKADVEAAGKSPLNKGSRKRKGETEPVEAEIKAKRTRVTKAVEVVEADTAPRKGRNSAKRNSATIDGQNDVQESNLALKNRSSRRGLSNESELKPVVNSKKPKGSRNAKPAATAAKISLQSPKNTRGKVAKTVPSIVPDTSSAVDAKSKFRSQKVAFDVPPTPVAETSTKKKAKQSEASTEKNAKKPAKGKVVSKKNAANKIPQESVPSPRKSRSSAAVAKKNLRSAKK